MDNDTSDVNKASMFRETYSWLSAYTQKPKRIAGFYCTLFLRLKTAKRLSHANLD
jgi:hypothetical protein